MERNNYNQLSKSIQFSAAPASSSNALIFHNEPAPPSSSTNDLQFSAASPSSSNNEVSEAPLSSSNNFLMINSGAAAPSSSNNALIIHNEPEIGMNEDYFKSFPPGFRFCPKDVELIEEYLKKKVYNQPLPPNKICVGNIYSKPPEELTKNIKPITENVWYFFTPREKKYPNGKRPRRSTSDKGFWKATGTDKEILNDAGQLVGLKTTLDYLEGKHQQGTKTDWKMHEYKLKDEDNPSRTVARSRNDMTLDDFVLCRVYYKKKGKNSKDEDLATVEMDVENQPSLTVSQNQEASSMLRNDHNDEFEQNQSVQAALDYSYHHQPNTSQGFLLGNGSTNMFEQNQVANLPLLDNNGLPVHQSTDHTGEEFDYSIYDGLEDLD